jgi:hypothetical protein
MVGERSKLTIPETTYRLAFLVLLLTLFAMRFYFMFKVRRSGERLMPDEGAVHREGGGGVLMVRVVRFFALLASLGMYVAGMRWIDAFLNTMSMKTRVIALMVISF